MPLAAAAAAECPIAAPTSRAISSGAITAASLAAITLALAATTLALAAANTHRPRSWANGVYACPSEHARASASVGRVARGRRLAPRLPRRARSQAGIVGECILGSTRQF